MVDRRQGRPTVSPLQYWLGIAGTVTRLVIATLKVGQWTGSVNESVRGLTNSVATFEKAAAAISAEQQNTRLELQKNAIAIENLKERFDERIERLTSTPRVVSGKGIQ